MTKKLYWIDPYQRIFSATVLAVEGNQVVLDQTCFYPQGGGQVGDTGEIQGLRVVDTQKGKDGSVVHILSQQPLLILGQPVVCNVDWERRYRIMKLHTASHVMEHFLLELYPGLRILGSHVNEKHDESTYKIDTSLDPQDMDSLNKKVNDFLARNLPINVYTSTNDPDFRYWECGGIRMPCGGTHPRNTSEVGRIRIRFKPKGVDKVRVYTEFDQE